MTLQNLAGISIARSNKTFVIPDSDGKGGGIAETSDPILVKAIHKLTSVRKHTAGAVTLLLRKFYKQDMKECCVFVLMHFLTLTVQLP